MRGMSSPLPFAFCLLPFAFSLPFVHNVALLRAVRIREALQHEARRGEERGGGVRAWFPEQDRKSTRLNSSHVSISYAVFCLKKKISETCCCLDSLVFFVID